MYRIGIIGVGHVGSHIAKEIISQGLADEIYIYERNLDFANAQALDLHQSTLLGKDIDVKVSTLEELTECDIVINTASGKITDGNRLEELKETGRIIEEIFTPFKNKFKEEHFQEYCFNILEMMISRSSFYFEKLPLIENVELLRNIIYSGIWTKFELIKKKRMEEKS